MMRIGSVPYLNAKPMVDWFHSAECESPVEVVYAVPSRLAEMLREGSVDVANVSIFETFQNPDLILIPDLSISACGAVKSVRLFSKKPLHEIESVALDTSSLTSNALLRILLKEQFGIIPCYSHHIPDIYAMLENHDAGLIIGDLKLFEGLPDTVVYDLGQAWYDLTELPFVYAAWSARRDRVSLEMCETLHRAMGWGSQHLETLAAHWAGRWNLPVELATDYLVNVMDYRLSECQIEGLRLYQRKCFEQGLIGELHPIETFQP